MLSCVFSMSHICLQWENVIYISAQEMVHIREEKQRQQGGLVISSDAGVKR